MKTEKRKNELGEVFTPVELVNEILDKLPGELWDDSEKTWLDNSCGNGNFLVEVKRRLLEHGHSLENVLGRIYGVDIMHDNIDECRHRLDPKNEYPGFVIRNIVQDDALRYHYRFDFSSPCDDILERERILDKKEKELKKKEDEFKKKQAESEKSSREREKMFKRKEKELKEKENEVKKKEEDLKSNLLSIFPPEKSA